MPAAPGGPPAPTVRLQRDRGQRAPRCGPPRAPPRCCPSRARCPSGPTSTRWPPATGGAGAGSTEVHLCLELEGTGRVDVYRTKADGSAIFVRGVVLDGPGPPRAGPGAGPAPVRGRRLVLVRPDHRRPRADPARRRLVRGRGGHRPGRGDHRHAHLQPAGRLRGHADRDRRGPAGAGRGDRGDPARPGHQEGARRARLRRGRGRARGPAADHRPAQPRRLRRLRPGHVRGARVAPTASRSCSWTTTSCSSRTRCCGRSRSPGSPGPRCWSAARCCRCRPAPSCPRWARWSTATPSCGATRRAPSRTTTCPSARCARPPGCTAGSTSTTTPGGCA